MAKRTWFHPPVPVLIGRDRINVNSLQRAAELLMSDDWPENDPMCERAAVKLIEALQGETAPDEARLGFIEEAESRRLGRQVNPGTAVNVWRSTAHENEALPFARAYPIWQNRSDTQRRHCGRGREIAAGSPLAE
jgi:hypothetical protein